LAAVIQNSELTLRSSFIVELIPGQERPEFAQITNFDPSFSHPNGFSGRIIEDRQTVRGMIHTSVPKIDKTSSGALPCEY